jgi:hypothetical protein
MEAPMCSHCKVQTVFRYQTGDGDFRPNRAVYECPSCFIIVSEPICYQLKPVS